jgi:flagellar protein FlaJ
MAQAKEHRKRTAITSMAEVVGSRFPDLRKKLRLAGMDETPTEFLEKVLYTALLISGGLILLVYAYLYFLEVFASALATDMPLFIGMIVVPLLGIPAIIFPYLMLYPDAMMMRRQRELDYEIVFAGRHIVIALKSGMPLFDTFVGTSNGYGAVSKEFAKIVDKVVLGVPLTQAIREVVQYNPSKYFTRMLMQVANALSSGADVGDSLESVLEQISKEQLIALKEYSQKLTPIVMFYMVFGIIVPSLGIVLATVVFSAISGGTFGFSSGILVITLFIIGLVQFLFLGFIESSRPKYLI